MLSCKWVFYTMGMNVFNALRKYATKWQLKDERPFGQDEINAVASAKVVDSNYGYSVCFVMRSGGMTYIPLDDSSSLVTGDTVDLSKATLVTLCKEGEEDIYRVRA